MKKIEKLEIKTTKQGDNVAKVLVAFANEMVVIKHKINELIDYVAWLEDKMNH